MSINFILGILLLAGGICLQVFLAPKGKWVGLILPALWFIYSFYLLYGVYIYERYNPQALLHVLVPAFLIYNIPTMILLIAYFAKRRGVK